MHVKCYRRRSFETLISRDRWHWRDLSGLRTCRARAVIATGKPIKISGLTKELSPERGESRTPTHGARLGSRFELFPQPVSTYRGEFCLVVTSRRKFRQLLRTSWQLRFKLCFSPKGDRRSVSSVPSFCTHLWRQTPSAGNRVPRLAPLPYLSYTLAGSHLSRCRPVFILSDSSNQKRFIISISRVSHIRTGTISIKEPSRLLSQSIIPRLLIRRLPTTPPSQSSNPSSAILRTDEGHENIA